LGTGKSVNTKKIPLHTTLLPISKKHNPIFNLDLIFMRSCSVLVTPRITVITAGGLRFNQTLLLSLKKLINRASSRIYWGIAFEYQAAWVVL
jgi:hypothetical protein